MALKLVIIVNVHSIIRVQRKKDIPGGFLGEGDDKGKYVRVMKSLDVSDESIVAKVNLVDALVC